MLKLSELIRDLDMLNPAGTIYAAEPWTGDSAAMVAVEPEAGGLPEEARGAGLSYFIEVEIFREFLADWQANLGRPTTLKERCERLIEYALRDA